MNIIHNIHRFINLCVVHSVYRSLSAEYQMEVLDAKALASILGLIYDSVIYSIESILLKGRSSDKPENDRIRLITHCKSIRNSRI